MIDTLAKYTLGVELNGDISHDVSNFLMHHEQPRTAVHCGDVATEARRLARKFGVDPERAEIGGWLHDISAVIPSKRRAIVARELGVDVLPEEDTFPMILHQKLSVVFSRELFGITDEGTLSAIGCHTTLRRDATRLDKVVFVADKIAWDQPGDPPYIDEITAALNQSIDHAALVYLQHLWDLRDKLKVLHPWTKDAYEQLSEQLS